MSQRNYATAILGGFVVLALALLGLRWQALAERTEPPPPELLGVLQAAAYQPPRGRDASKQQPTAGAGESKSRGVSPSRSPQPKSEVPSPSNAKQLPAPRSINVNTAPLEELDRLPGIGPALGQRIIEHREQHGPFKGVASLLDVKGIGPKKLEQLSIYVTVN